MRAMLAAPPSTRAAACAGLARGCSRARPVAPARRAVTVRAADEPASGGAGQQALSRRALVGLIGAGAAAAAAAGGAARAEGDVRVGASVVRTDEEWRALLSPGQYKVLRQAGTELPRTSPLNKEKRRGTFVCAGCGARLFPSATKYDSGTGWPSFYAPLDGAVVESSDLSIPFMPRTEVSCRACGGHLGHVFDDGPPPTGLRYCMNGLALSFNPEGESAGEAARTGGAGYVFLAGSISGVAEGITIQPLEMLKTRFQIHAGEHLRIIPTIKDIVAEGGVAQLYRGGAPEILGLIPRATAALSTLELSRRTFRSWHDGHLTPGYAYLSGALSGVTEGVAFAPFQVVKVRLMAKEHLGRYRNSAHCLRELLRAEGPAALFIGLAPTLLRNCIWNCIYYGSMHQIEHHHLPRLENRGADALRQLGVGTAVGIAATTCNAPFDVVKSRFQSELPGQRRFTRVLPSLVTIAREEGPRALYRGFVPKALRLGIGQSVGLIMFENLLIAFGAAADEDAGS
ncbi:msrB [Scenedesmus sp. PABB004]|nr:msrB [Scenedesmus sp. PABB004]